MKIKTSVSLSAEVITQLQEFTSEGNRSDFIEKAILSYFEILRRNARNKQDEDILNAEYPHLNGEAIDILSFQAQL